MLIHPSQLILVGVVLAMIVALVVLVTHRHVVSAVTEEMDLLRESLHRHIADSRARIVDEIRSHVVNLDAAKQHITEAVKEAVPLTPTGRLLIGSGVDNGAELLPRDGLINPGSIKTVPGNGDAPVYLGLTTPVTDAHPAAGQPAAEADAQNAQTPAA
jgi:hypothetical protein